MDLNLSISYFFLVLFDLLLCTASSTMGGGCDTWFSKPRKTLDIYVYFAFAYFRILGCYSRGLTNMLIPSFVHVFLSSIIPARLETVFLAVFDHGGFLP